jgi:hypothetical protein
MYNQSKINIKKARIQVIYKLFEEGILSNETSYKDKRKIANDLEWSIGILNSYIDLYNDQKKEIERLLKNKKEKVSDPPRLSF